MERKEEIVDRILSSEWKSKSHAVAKLLHGFGEDALPDIVRLLESDCGDVRNAAALGLRDLGSNRAVEPLFATIQKLEGRESIATLVYALEVLDCRDYFNQVMELALSSYADVRIAAMNILMNQGFIMDDSDLERARGLLSDRKLQFGESTWIAAVENRLDESA